MIEIRRREAIVMGTEILIWAKRRKKCMPILNNDNGTNFLLLNIF